MRNSKGIGSIVNKNKKLKKITTRIACHATKLKYKSVHQPLRQCDQSKRIGRFCRAKMLIRVDGWVNIE